MTNESNFQNQLKSSHGRAWTVEEFRAEYDLDEAEAHRLYFRFGPYSNDLKVLMNAKMEKDLVSSAEVLNISL